MNPLVTGVIESEISVFTHSWCLRIRKRAQRLKKRKSLTELTLLDRFLFSEVMEDPENMETILKIILGTEILLKYLPQVEKEQTKTPLYRFAKIDVWCMDQKEIVYDTEVQKINTKNLPKRSRCYQGMINSKLLQSGETNFNNLNPVFIIIIGPFDLFGYDKYMYTFQMKCDELADLKLEDGATRIFLNTRGKNEHEVSPELVELLHYIEHTNERKADSCQNPKLKKLRERVTAIQQNAEVSVRYMPAWEELIMEKNESREEGRKMLLLELISKKQAKGKSLEQIADELEESVDTITALLSEQQH